MTEVGSTRALSQKYMPRAKVLGDNIVESSSIVFWLVKVNGCYSYPEQLPRAGNLHGYISLLLCPSTLPKCIQSGALFGKQTVNDGFQCSYIFISCSNRLPNVPDGIFESQYWKPALRAIQRASGREKGKGKRPGRSSQ